MYAEAPRTPLRRGSQRYLAESKPFRASTSSAGEHDGEPTPWSSLEGTFHEIADELEGFMKNLQQIKLITQKLEERAESVAMFLQAQRMNTYCVEFPQAPTDASFEQYAIREAQRVRARTPTKIEAPSDPKTPRDANREHDRTFATNSAAYTPVAPTKEPPKKTTGIAKPGAMTNKMRKERLSTVDTVINLLPLEFRGNDPQLRKTAEAVINALMDAKRPLKITEIAKGPLLPQAKVNKCLIGLVNAKAAIKSTEQGVSHYAFAKSCLP
ncbi:SubName: Full=Uncharacterized protein {ECO:0000313/EMBL:CCA70255.1} [Serendipita indica DSM 11827]|nr:SubName: Full=Uncharacterized protein {ECO:0000313/EMBL:CCA70255.1} [Serendipita indica DSM 11827]